MLWLCIFKCKHHKSFVHVSIQTLIPCCFIGYVCLNLFISNRNPSPNLAQQRVLFTLILNRIDTITVALEIGAGGSSTAGVVVGYWTEAEKLQPQNRLIQHNMIRIYLMLCVQQLPAGQLSLPKGIDGPGSCDFRVANGTTSPVQQKKRHQSRKLANK